MDTLIIVLMVCPDYFFAEVGDIKTDFAHTINIWEAVPPIVKLFYGCVPVVIEIWLICISVYVLIGFFEILEMRIIKVTANVAICHLKNRLRWTFYGLRSYNMMSSLDPYLKNTP